MIAGFAVALEMGYDLETMVKFASACGTANAMEVETGKVNIENVHKIISHGDGSFGWFLSQKTDIYLLQVTKIVRMSGNCPEKGKMLCSVNSKTYCKILKNDFREIGINLS